MAVDRKELIISFAKYLVAGGGGFICDYLTLFVLYQVWGLHYLAAAAVAFVAGVLFVYFVSNQWVFDKRKLRHNQMLEFGIFLLIGVIGLGLTVLFMWCFVDGLGIHPLVAKLLTTAIVLMWNFGARKAALY